MDSEDTEDILKTVYENAHIQSRTYTFDMARDHISAMKNEMQHIAYLADISNDRLLADYENASDIPEKVFLGYLYEQKKVYGLDYDDLITIALHILRTDAEKCRKWQERMMYVMGDEFQDVSGNQYALAEILSGYHRNLFIVGDPDQTIYTWRGARIEYILNFDAEHEDTKTVFLDVNYRSIPEILAVSNSLIEKNKKRLPHRLEAYKKSGRRPQYIHSKTTGDEARWMTAEIQKLISTGNSYSDIAVIYRSHFVSRSIEEAFIKSKIPYTLYSGVEFYKRKEIKDVLAYELSCRGGKFEATPEERDWNKRKRGNENMICIGNPQSFAFAEDVIDALIEIFPSQYIHFGGDEVPTDIWEECPKCKQAFVQ